MTSKQPLIHPSIEDIVLEDVEQEENILDLNQFYVPNNNPNVHEKENREKQSDNQLCSTNNQSRKDTCNSTNSKILQNTHLSQPASIHNFQKHTVVTIKKLTKGLTLKLGTTTAEKVALQMWNIFLSSGIKSKKILVILFGRSNMWDEKYKELLKNCFFGELCSHDDQLIRAAQSILRLKGEVKINIQNNRYIRLKQEFIAYFNQFLEQLRQGPLTKFRIDARTVKKINQTIKEGMNNSQVIYRYEDQI